MTKVSIIEVDLGLRISDIIKDDVIALTGAAQVQLTEAIAERKQIEKVKIERSNAKKKASDKIVNALTKAYEALEEAAKNGDGVTVETIMEIIDGAVPNTSAFTLRMKKFLKDKDNPYMITRKKISKVAHYFFEAFNEDPQESP